MNLNLIYVFIEEFMFKKLKKLNHQHSDDANLIFCLQNRYWNVRVAAV